MATITPEQQALIDQQIAAARAANAAYLQAKESGIPQPIPQQNPYLTGQQPMVQPTMSTDVANTSKTQLWAESQQMAQYYQAVWAQQHPGQSYIGPSAESIMDQRLSQVGTTQRFLDLQSQYQTQHYAIVGSSGVLNPVNDGSGRYTYGSGYSAEAQGTLFQANVLTQYQQQALQSAIQTPSLQSSQMEQMIGIRGMTHVAPSVISQNIMPMVDNPQVARDMGMFLASPESRQPYEDWFWGTDRMGYASARTPMDAMYMGRADSPFALPPGSASERFGFDEYGNVLGSGFPNRNVTGFNPKMGSGDYVYVGEYHYMETGETVSRYYERNVGSYIDVSPQGVFTTPKIMGVRSGGSPGSFRETRDYATAFNAIPVDTGRTVFAETKALASVPEFGNAPRPFISTVSSSQPSIWDKAAAGWGKQTPFGGLIGATLWGDKKDEVLGGFIGSSVDFVTGMVGWTPFKDSMQKVDPSLSAWRTQNEQMQATATPEQYNVFLQKSFESGILVKPVNSASFIENPKLIYDYGEYTKWGQGVGNAIKGTLGFSQEQLDAYQYTVEQQGLVEQIVYGVGHTFSSNPERILTGYGGGVAMVLGGKVLGGIYTGSSLATRAGAFALAHPTTAAVAGFAIRAAVPTIMVGATAFGATEGFTASPARTAVNIGKIAPEFAGMMYGGATVYAGIRSTAVGMKTTIQKVPKSEEFGQMYADWSNYQYRTLKKSPEMNAGILHYGKPIPEGTILYRGVSKLRFETVMREHGIKYRDYGPQSFTTELETAREFANWDDGVILKYEVEAPIRVIQEHPRHTNPIEREVTIPGNVEFTIDRIETKRLSDITGETTTTYTTNAGTVVTEPIRYNPEITIATLRNARMQPVILEKSFAGLDITGKGKKLGSEREITTLYLEGWEKSAIPSEPPMAKPKTLGEYTKRLGETTTTIDTNIPRIDLSQGRIVEPTLSTKSPEPWQDMRTTVETNPSMRPMFADDIIPVLDSSQVSVRPANFFHDTTITFKGAEGEVTSSGRGGATILKMVEPEMVSEGVATISLEGIELLPTKDFAPRSTQTIQISKAAQAARTDASLYFSEANPMKLHKGFDTSIAHVGKMRPSAKGAGTWLNVQLTPDEAQGYLRIALSERKGIMSQFEMGEMVGVYPIEKTAQTPSLKAAPEQKLRVLQIAGANILKPPVQKARPSRLPMVMPIPQTYDIPKSTTPMIPITTQPPEVKKHETPWTPTLRQPIKDISPKPQQPDTPWTPTTKTPITEVTPKPPYPDTPWTPTPTITPKPTQPDNPWTPPPDTPWTPVTDVPPPPVPPGGFGLPGAGSSSRGWNWRGERSWTKTNPVGADFLGQSRGSMPDFSMFGKRSKKKLTFLKFSMPRF